MWITNYFKIYNQAIRPILLLLSITDMFNFFCRKPSHVPVILTGDLNTQPDSELYQQIITGQINYTSLLQDIWKKNSDISELIPATSGNFLDISINITSIFLIKLSYFAIYKHNYFLIISVLPLDFRDKKNLHYSERKFVLNPTSFCFRKWSYLIWKYVFLILPKQIENMILIIRIGI